MSAFEPTAKHYDKHLAPTNPTNPRPQKASAAVLSAASLILSVGSLVLGYLFLLVTSQHYTGWAGLGVVVHTAHTVIAIHALGFLLLLAGAVFLGEWRSGWTAASFLYHAFMGAWLLSIFVR